VLVIALMLFIIGVLNQTRGTTIFGIRGPEAAWTFLGWVFGILGGVLFAYLMLRSSLRQMAVLDAVLLRVPVLGPCLQALALGRFALALGLTLDSSLPIARALRLSLRATGNAAYLAREDQVARVLGGGGDLAGALAGARLFPESFLHTVAVAEASGQLPEVMRRQRQEFVEEAERRLRALTRAMTTALWLIYAGLITVAIFRIASVYLDALSGPPKR
jgi:type IV pilus assembly protein PilC